MSTRPDLSHEDTSRLEETSRALADWFDLDAPPHEPVHLLGATLYRTARTRRRAAWRDPERWLPMTLVAHRSPTVATLRVIFMILAVALLALALAAGAAIVGSQPSSRNDPNDTLNALPAAALLPTSCPAGTPLKSGDIATVAGTESAGLSGDGGPAIAAWVDANAITVDAAGAVYLSQGTSIRRIDGDGLISTFVGPRSGGRFVFPIGLVFDAAGDLLVADPGDLRTSYIWKVDPVGKVIPVAGKGVFGSTGNDGPALDAEIEAAIVTVGPRGDLYFDDQNGFRTVDTAGVIHAFAGTGVAGFSGDNGPALEATIGLSDPVTLGVAADGAGNVYLGDPSNHRIRKVDSAGVITTVAGTGVAGYSGDQGPAVDATIDSPGQLAVDAAGNVFFVDVGTIRRIDPAGVITTVAGTGVAGFSGDCGPAVAAQVAPTGVAVHDGIVYIGDEGNYRIRMIVP